MTQSTFSAPLAALRQAALHAGPVVVALSGGLDSCTLLHILTRVLHRHRNPIFPCAVAHGIRASEPEFASEALPAYCSGLGLDLRVFRIRQGWLAQQAQQRGLSLEDLARSERYRRLRHYCAELRQQLGAGQNSQTIIALAHHADDQAEGFLLNALRGAGPCGLAGMRQWQHTQQEQILLWRPLLRWNRADLQLWAQQHQLPHWEDRSNFDGIALRNLYRWQLLPQLKRLQPRLRQGIQRSQKHLQIIADWLDQERTALKTQIFAQAPSPGPVAEQTSHQVLQPGLAWRGSFDALPPPLQLELVYLLYDRLRRGEQRRRRLPLGFVCELQRQWRQGAQAKVQAERKALRLHGHGCLWQLEEDQLVVWPTVAKLC